MIIIFGLLIILVSFLIYQYKNYFNNKYVTINIYDEYYIRSFMLYVKKNKQYYDVCVSINYGDKSIKITNQSGVYTKNFNDKWFNNTHDVYTDFGHKINFNDKNLNIEGYYTFENAVIEDKNKNKVSIKYIKMNILKKTDNVDIKSIFDKIIVKNDASSLIYYFLDVNENKETQYRRNRFHEINDKIINCENKLSPSFFHKDSDMLWSLIKNVYLNTESQFAKNKILLHGPAGCGKSTFIHNMAIYLKKDIMAQNFENISRITIYAHMFANTKTRIFLLENLDIILKELHKRELTNKKYNKCLKLSDLLSIIRNPFVLKSTIATTTNYDEIKKSYPEFAVRLIPIHFGYINSDTLQDISMYFFGVKIKSYIPDVIMIPTSEIIDLAFESLTVSKIPFDYFNDKLLKLI